MNSINDLREIYDDLYRLGTAAAAARATLPEDTGDGSDATNAELLPVIEIQPARRPRRGERFAPLAAAAAIVAIMALTGGLLFALRPWSNDGKIPAGAQASTASSAMSKPSAANTTPTAAASSPPTRADTTANPTQVSASSARCYATADVGRSDNYFSVTIGNGDGHSQSPAGPLALQHCTTSWREGILSTKPPYKIDNPPESANLPVPALVACVLPASKSDEGAEEVAILPGSAGTCSELGLSVYPGSR